MDNIFRQFYNQKIWFFTLLFVLSHLVVAKNIDLSTIPARDSVQLTIYNAEDLTLVRETRQVSIKKGRNQLQFSWVNTKIDPTSVHIQFVSHPQKMQLVNTTYPHDKPQMLYWNINSEVDISTSVEISYFTSGISWRADYTGIMASDGKDMLLHSFITINNHSGENYENAEVRLVLGEINLVESIDEVVRQANQRRDEIGHFAKSKRDYAKKLMSKPPGRYEMRAMPVPMAAMEGEVLADAKTVEKDSLSEYTIFSIEGKESIPNQWAKRLRSSSPKKVKVASEYRYRPREYGQHLVGVLIFANNTSSNLGESPLPNGKIQLYREKQSGSMSYINQIALDYASVGEKIELNMGTNPDIIFESAKLKNWRDNIWMHYKKGNVYRRIDDGHIIIDHNSQVAGWDEHAIFVQHIRNHTNQPIKVEIRRLIEGDAKFTSSLEVKRHDFQQVNIYTQLQSGESQELLYQTSIAKGRNSKQKQLQLVNKNISYPTF